MLASNDLIAERVAIFVEDVYKLLGIYRPVDLI
jgi:hypothetical protein